MNDNTSRTRAISAMSDDERKSLLAYISGYAPLVFDGALENWRRDTGRDGTETGDRS